MKRTSSIKNLCVSAICVALCYILPLLFHSIGAGQAFSPMHFPVLLCGIICGPIYGLGCAILGPILSSVLSGMPPAPMLITMIPELCVYALAAGILFKLIRTKSLVADLYISLIPAMLLGRVAGGVAKVLMYLNGADAFTAGMWVSSYFVGTFPGIIAQLIVIPVLTLALIKTGIIQNPYAKAEVK